GFLRGQEMAEVAAAGVVGFPRAGRGVKDHHPGAPPAAAPPVAGLLQQAGQPLGIVEVHLAPVGANLVRAHVLLLGLRGYACPGTSRETSVAGLGKLPWQARGGGDDTAMTESAPPPPPPPPPAPPHGTRPPPPPPPP